MIEIVFEKRIVRRASFVLANLVFCALFVAIVVVPILGYFEDRESRIADQRNMLSRLAGIAAQETYVRSVETDTSSQLKSGEFLSGPNDSVINADLQTKLKTISEAAGARLHAVQGLPTRTRGSVKYSGSRVEISGPLQSIQRALISVESAKPYLFIVSASIRTTASAGRPGVSEQPIIHAQLDVFGAVQAEGGGR
jgi:general secretion pathway protein M